MVLIDDDAALPAQEASPGRRGTAAAVVVEKIVGAVATQGALAYSLPATSARRQERVRSAKSRTPRAPPASVIKPSVAAAAASCRPHHSTVMPVSTPLSFRSLGVRSVAANRCSRTVERLSKRVTVRGMSCWAMKPVAPRCMFRGLSRLDCSAGEVEGPCG
ncbi:dihydroxyacetone kinase subunit DhaK [Streptomyces sp. 205]|uniref:Dihydroxyacetone kinase subunit DhaK n=1 Tax=Streptomyces coffeae TaxID=621382 RepID=A0ABS1NRU5_9ACTN|nr:dihydroxyacetone kinase subunit DhaK [Streptomyces coffeae]